MRRSLAALLCLFALSFAAPVPAQAPQPARTLHPVRMITFGGGYSLPAWVAQRQGFFEKHGLVVSITYTPDSVFLMTGLIEGRYDIAVTAIDNLRSRPGQRKKQGRRTGGEEAPFPREGSAGG